MESSLLEQQEALIEQKMTLRLSGCTRREEMSRAAAALLFFDFGVYPSAKTVLKHIRRGSITDINNDLREFWSELRNRSKTKLNTPDIPDQVAERFSESLSEIWELCLSKANESLNGAKAELAVFKLEAEAAVLNAEARSKHFERDAIRLQEKNEELHRTIAESEATNARMSARLEFLESSLEQAKAGFAEEKAAHTSSIAAHKQELERERNDRKLEAERFDGEVKFAKLQIDQARKGERLLKEQLEDLRKQYADDLASNRIRASKAEEETAKLRVDVAQANDLVRESYRRTVLRAHSPARPAASGRKRK